MADAKGREKMIRKFFTQFLGGRQPALSRRGAQRTALVASSLSVTQDNTFYLGDRPAGRAERERLDYDREEVLRLALEAWRVNPLARRIVGLVTQYVVGGGVEIRSEDEGAHAFLKEWWDHRLNQLGMRIYEWCDELSRAGELFLLVSTDAAGMSYVRAVPAADISEIETAENDVQQEKSYTQKSEMPGEEVTWPAYDEQQDGAGEDGRFAPVMLHYAINRPVGAVRGESDLAPLLRWLSRYAAWLEDRARLNRYRNSFLFVVKARYNSEEERLARQNALTLNPPTPGSILVADESETWEVISPKLESHEAGEDGLALKKMIAAGAGLPLHFLAEPESSTRTTAESAGGPTYRHFEQRQEFFLWVLEDLARVVLKRASRVGRVDGDAKIEVQGADLSARDNAALAVAMSTVTGALLELRRAGMIDDAEVVRLAYRFGGEVVDVEEILEEGRKAGPGGKDMAGGKDRPGGTGLPGGKPVKRPAGVKVDGESGEVRV